MATAVPLNHPFTPERVKRWTKYAVGALVVAVLGGFFAALFTYQFTARLNTESAVQQQRLAALQEFVASGSDLDASVTDLSDAVVDRRDTTDAKKEVRRAIARHASASESLKEFVGQANMNAYEDGLGVLRDFVDKANDPHSTMNASQARFDIMANRKAIIAEARRKIYS